MFEPKYPCGDCDGRGEVECHCCGSGVDCDSCEGTGLDSAVVDIKAWLAARKAFENQVPWVSTWDWIEGDSALGRQSDTGTLGYDQFLRIGAGEGGERP